MSNCYTLLQRRNRGWYVRYYVPTAQQPTLGRAEVTRTLQTLDRREAAQRAPAKVALIQAELLRVVPATRPASDPNSIMETAQRLREAIDAGELAAGDQVSRCPQTGDVAADPCPADVILGAAIDGHLETIRGPRDMDGYPDVSPELALIIEHSQSVVSGRKRKSLGDCRDTYLRDGSSGPKPWSDKTLDAKQRALKILVGHFGRLRDPLTIGRADAATYVRDVVKSWACKGKTMQDHVNQCSSFFSWMSVQGMFGDRINPFLGQAGRIQAGKGGEEKPRRAWRKDELATLLRAPFPRPHMSAVVLFGLFTGARLNELCTLKVDDVDFDEGAFNIRTGKTQKSVRVVPMHPILVPLFRTLVDSSRDGFVISDQPEVEFRQPRSRDLSKDFGRWRRRVGLAGKDIPFHSLRNTLTSALEADGVPESDAGLAIGHKSQAITYRVYGTSNWRKIKPIMEGLSYGDEIDGLARDLISDHVGNPKSGTYSKRGITRSSAEPKGASND